MGIARFWGVVTIGALLGVTSAKANCIHTRWEAGYRLYFTNFCGRNVIVKFADEGSCNGGCATGMIRDGETSMTFARGTVDFNWIPWP
jgi:hypothetical protein